MRARHPSLRRDERGAALVEFALIAPVLVLTLLGVFEVGYNFYMQTQFQGAVQTSARSSTIENAASREAAIDAIVEDAVKLIDPRAELAFERQAYSSFADVGEPEDFDDLNGDGACNDGEPFEDANGNGEWDADRGKAGFGGARDVVLYRVTVSYPRAFALSKMLGFPDHVEFEATTVLRNQPYDEQTVLAGIGNCL